MPEFTDLPSRNLPLAPLLPGIAGWVTHPETSPHTSPAIDKLISGLNTKLDTHPLTTPTLACAGTAPPFLAEDSSVGIIIGTPRWTDTRIREIAQKQGHSAGLIAAYNNYGSKLTQYMKGAYSFAIIDPTTNTTLLCIDRLGRYPLYYHSSESNVVFGSSAKSVLELIERKYTIQTQGIYDYAYFHMVPGPATIYEGINKLQAGCLTQICEGQVSTLRHWHPVFSESPDRDVHAMYRELKTRLSEAVITNIPDQGKVGAFLSGGLDSSTVTGMLAEASDGPCDVYSIGFSAEGYDEMEYARLTAKHFGANLHEYYVTPEDVVSALPLIATSYDEPFGNSSALPAYFCARMAAEDGVSLLLAGDGGDEIFAGNERYAKQKAFEIYQKVPAFLGKGLLEPLVNAGPGWLPLAAKARSYLAQANTPLPDRLQTYNFLHQHLPSEMFQADFLEQVDTSYPLTLQREIYNTPDSASSLNRMLFMDWQFTLADNDLRKVSQTCALAGVDVAYPMLDDGLVEFSMGIPSEWKLPGNQLRDFYKKALTGWLPDATLNKSKQGFGLPFGVWMHTHRPLQEIAYDNILKLKTRDIFNNDFLDNAIAMHRDEHAAYFGELIWILTVLELWLESR